MADDTTTDAPAADAAAEAPEVVTDDRREALLAVFVQHLGDAVLESHIRPGQGLWIRVANEAWVTAGEVAQGPADVPFFDFLSAIDWMPSPYGRYEDSSVDVPFPPPMPDPSSIAQGIAGGDTRMQVIASTARVGTDLRVFLKADVADDDPRIGSWSRIFGGASWHERETWEMFGISFDGLADVRHLYLPGEFEGNPLRKEFPLLARVVKPWPGIVDVEPMPGGDDEEEEAAEGADA